MQAFTIKGQSNGKSTQGGCTRLSIMLCRLCCVVRILNIATCDTTYESLDALKSLWHSQTVFLMEVPSVLCEVPTECRVIHNFRTRLRNNQDRHSRKKHINR